MNCAALIGQSSVAIKGKTEKRHAHSIVDLFATDPADILLEGGKLCGPTEEHENLVEGVRCKVVHKPVGIERKVLPRPFELHAEAVKPVGGSMARCLEQRLSV